MSERQPGVPQTIKYAILCVVMIALASCSGAGNKGSTSGYVSATGQITKVKIADRKAAPILVGDDLDGRPISSASYAGKVLVVNVWGSWCGPCRAEGPTLEKVSRKYADKGVQFLGILVRDRTAAGLAFNRNKGITYPSISDYSARSTLGFNGSLPSQAIPTTWIIDSKGRVAVRIMVDGLTADTLSGLIDDVQAGTA